ncbi:MAG: nickel-dependent hydrogenase large subunit [Thermoleophilia bacterium]|nr:nickel-dependent hydrogenase large subunit [Thermoleophilia bacterium]
MTKVVIDPITRIEGHLRITCVVENGKVTDAWNTATMFRGFEIFMKDRDPKSIWQFAQRICGVCPTPHAYNSVRAVENAAGMKTVPDSVRLIRNMMETTQLAYDHILWFYHLNGFDYVNVPNALNAKPGTPGLKAVQDQVKAVVDSGQLGPFANMYWDHPGYKLPADMDLEITAHYLQALDIQQKACDASAVLGGRYPMINNYVPGGVTQMPSIEDIEFYISQMGIVKDFIDTVMVPDLLAIAPYYLDLATYGKGVGNFLTWGVLDEKSQDPYDRLFPRGGIFDGKLALEKVDLAEARKYTKTSWFPDDLGGGKHPLEVGQIPQQFTKMPAMDGTAGPAANDKYDWTQALRYGKEVRPMEVGPLAQVLVAYLAGRPEAKKLVDDTLAAIGHAGDPTVLLSNLGRVAARVLKAKINSDNALRWANELLANIGSGETKIYEELDFSKDGTGESGWDAPRGALAHYAKIKGGKIDTYAANPPSNWNLSPRDDNGVRGPVEEALVGIPVVDTEKPLEILRTVHTFDP